MKTVENPSIEELIKENAKLLAEVALVKEQLEWLKKQIFGKKSEKIVRSDPNVMYLPGLEQYFLDDEGSNENNKKTNEEPKTRRKPVRDSKDAIKASSLER